MTDFPYTKSHGNIKRLFEQIQSSGKPEKATQNWLKLIGLKSSNDSRLPGLLKFIGFTDSSGIPDDDIWLAYKNKDKSSAILAQAIRTAYSDLFNIYSDAHRKDDEALRNYFSSKTGVGATTVAAMVNTFKSLVELADFNSEVPENLKDEILEKSEEKRSNKKPTNTNIEGNGLSVTVNIQLQIAATEDASIYDKFFQSLYKHVLSKNKE